MALTQKQQNFCLAYIKCGNASQAYRESYNAEKMSDKQIWEEASKLNANPKVSQRVQELNEKATTKAILSVEERKEILSNMARNVVYDKEGNATFSDARGAIEILNKMDGLYTQKIQAEHSGEVGVKFEIVLDNSDN